MLYPLVNFKSTSTLQIKSSFLLYTSIIRPLISYACPVWAAASPTKIKKVTNITKQIFEDLPQSSVVYEKQPNPQ